MFFDGKFVSERKVDLRGASRGQAAAESRAELLARARTERAQRQAERARHRAATHLQAYYRGRLAQRRTRREVRARWVHRYGKSGERLTRDEMQLASGCLRELLFFAEEDAPGDLHCLASACRLLLQLADHGGGGGGGWLVAVLQDQPAALGPADAALARVRARRLLHLGFGALHQRRALVAAAAPSAAEATTGANTGNTSGGDHNGGEEEEQRTLLGHVTSFLLLLLLPPSSAGAAASGFLRSRSELVASWALCTRTRDATTVYPQLRAVLLAALQAQPRQLDAPPPQPPPPLASAAHAIVQQLVALLARALASQVLTAPQRDGLDDDAERAPAAAAGVGDAHLQEVTVQLLTVPCCLKRCPVLQRPQHSSDLLVLTCKSTDVAALLRRLRSQRSQLGLSSVAHGVASILANVVDAADACGYRLADSSAQGGVAAAVDSAPWMSLSFCECAFKLHLALPDQLVGMERKRRGRAHDDDDEGSGNDSGDGSDEDAMSVYADVPRPRDVGVDGSAPRKRAHASTTGAGVAASSAAAAEDAADTALHAAWNGERLEPGAEAALAALADGSVARRTLQRLMQEHGRPRILQPSSGSASAGSGLSAADVEMWTPLLQFVRRLLQLRGHRTQLLATLAFSDVNLAKLLWARLVQPHHVARSWPESASGGEPRWMLPVAVLAPVLSYAMLTLDDEDVLRDRGPLGLRDLYDTSCPQAGLVSLLKNALWQQLWDEYGSGRARSRRAQSLRLDVCTSAARLLGQLHDCNSRTNFAPAEAFHADHFSGGRFQQELQAAAGYRTGAEGLFGGERRRVTGLLQTAPFLVPFDERVRAFHVDVERDRRQHRQEAMHMMQPPQPITIRRGAIFEDAYATVGRMRAAQLKEQVRVRFVNQVGAEEAGIDGGGLFKDFLEELVKAGFSVQMGLWQANGEEELYPSPAAATLEREAPSYFRFLGCVVGKAMYEGILLELPFASFFLKALLGGAVGLNDLPSLDAGLHRSLNSLRGYDGDLRDLSLFFSITETDALGATREVELFPGGKDVAVTAENVIRYIHLVAHHRMHRQLAGFIHAFAEGMFTVLDKRWLRMFNESELQLLISGAMSGIDLDDMRAHTEYAGGYHKDHPVVLAFWEVVADFKKDDQSKLLRFVTSCSRPPLLGFGVMQPRICIAMAGLGHQDVQAQTRLPTAATCMNLLKLPPYRTPELMAEKLLYAIGAGAGFDLS